MHNVSRHERVQPLLRTRVVLKVICSVDDGNAVVVATDSGEEDLRRRKTVWRGDLCCGGRFRRWSSSAGADDGAAGAGQTTQSFL
jgi:hypothetical protein